MSDEQIIEAELKKHEQVLEKERARVELEEKRLAEEKLKLEAEEAKKRKREEERRKQAAKMEKSPTEQLFELGAELSVYEERTAGSVTDQIRGLSIENDPGIAPGNVTEKLQKLEVSDDPADPAFQRRRGEPSARVKSWNNPEGV